MAKSHYEDRDDTMLLDGLRRSIDGRPRLLQGPSERDALFPVGKAGEAPATRALAQALLILTDAPPGLKTTKTQRYARLTEKGRRFLLDYGSPKKSLEAVLPVLRETTSRIEQISQDLRQAMADQVAPLLALLQDMRGFIEEASRPREEPEEPEEAAAEEAPAEEAPAEELSGREPQMPDITAAEAAAAALIAHEAAGEAGTSESAAAAEEDAGPGADTDAAPAEAGDQGGAPMVPPLSGE